MNKLFWEENKVKLERLQGSPNINKVKLYEIVFEQIVY